MVRYILVLLIVLGMTVNTYSMEIDVDGNGAVDIFFGGTNAKNTAEFRENFDLEEGIDFYSVESADTLLGAKQDYLTSTYDTAAKLTALFASKVGTAGNETIAGVKTFSSSPVVPAPTTDMHPATKKYVDDNSGGSATVEDDVYGSGWNGDTTNAPSQNAVYDKIESLAGGHAAVTETGDGIILSGQDLSVHANLEGLADLTPVNNAFFGFDESGNPENKTTIFLQGTTGMEFEGAVVNEHKTTISITEPTNTNTVTHRDGSGTVILSGDEFTGEVTGTLGADGSTALTIGAGVIEELNIEATNSATDNYIISYDSGTGGFTWIPDATGGTPGADSIDYTHTTGSFKSLTPVTGDADNFLSTFTGANLYGGTFVANAPGTAVFPAVGIGMSFSIITGGAYEVIADPNASDSIFGDGTQGADGESMTNLSTAGDIMVCQYYTSSGWVCTTNGWTSE